MNSKHNPVSSAFAALAAMSMLSAVAEAAAQRRPGAAPQPAGNPDMSLQEMLAGVLGLTTDMAPAHSPIAQVCAIPQDIAERCGMNAACFDPHGLTGRTVALLAAVLSNLREMQDACDSTGRAQVAVAESHITAAVTAVHAALRTASAQQTSKPAV